MHDHTDYGSKECQDSCLKHGTMNLKDLKNLSLPFFLKIIIIFLKYKLKNTGFVQSVIISKKERLGEQLP